MVTGDVFSSLEGVGFDWTLLPDTEQGHDVITPAQNILR